MEREAQVIRAQGMGNMSERRGNERRQKCERSEAGVNERRGRERRVRGAEAEEN